jgi:hypothetical protein
LPTAIIYFVIFFLVALAHWIVTKRMTRQVNQHLPESEQYSTAIFPSSTLAFQRSARSPVYQFRIFQLHRQFFPESSLRWFWFATLILMIIFFALTAIADHQQRAVSAPPLP